MSSRDSSIVVVPTYNEVDNLPVLVEGVMAAGQYELLIVDDNSPDGTGQLADRLSAANPGRLWVIHRQKKQGLGRAYVDGFRHALAGSYDYIFQMDADLSHDPAALNDLRAALDWVDVAIGSRYIAGGGTIGWPRRRQLLSRWGSLYARTLLGLPLIDVTGGFKGFRRQALEAVDLDRISARGYGFQIEVTYQLYRAGFRLTEVPITFAERQTGTSKMSLNIVAEAMLLPWSLLWADRFHHSPAVPFWTRVPLLRSVLAPLRTAPDRDAR